MTAVGQQAQPPSLGRNLVALGASQAITWLATVAWTLVVPRVVGPGDTGILVTALAAGGLIGAVVGLPTRDFLTREMVAAPAAARLLLGSAWLIRVVLLPVVLLLTAAYALLAGFDGTGTAVLYVAGATTAAVLLTEPALAVFQSQEQMKYIAYSDVLTKTLQSAGGIVLALVGFRVLGIAVLNLAVSAFVLGMSVRWVRRLLPRLERPHLRAGVATARASLPYWGFGIFYTLYLWLDTLILAVLTPEQVVGYYGAATRIFTTLMFVPVILATTFLPRLVRAHESRLPDLYAAARAPLELLLVLGLPIGLLVATLAEPATALLYGHSYRGAGPVLAILGLCVPVMYLNIMFNQVLVAAKRPMVWTRVLAGATVLNLALNLVGVQVTQARYDNGAIGAALSLLLTEVAIGAAGVVLVGRHVVTGTARTRLLRVLLAGAALLAVVLATRALPWPLRLVPGLLTYAAVAVGAGAVSPDQRLLLVGSAQTVLGRLRRRPGGAT